MRDSIDACLARAFRDVPVPQGLAERLTAGLAVKRPRSRRRLAIGLAILTSAAGLLLAAWLGMPRSERFSEQYALDKALQSFESEVEQTGRSVAKHPAPEEYPLSRWVVPVREASWRHLDDFLGSPGVVYDLPGPTGSRASLYVVAREDIGDLETSPTLHPFTTAGCCVSAWQEDGLLYVLVVQGGPSVYGGYLNLPRSPVA